MRLLFVLSLSFFSLRPAQAERLLIPMDTTQRDHLKSYGLAFWILEHGGTIEWLLNYRGGTRALRARLVTGRCRYFYHRRACLLPLFS